MSTRPIAEPVASELHRWLAFDPDRARRVVQRFIESYLDGSGAQGIVLGLSGGLDSATVAALGVEALGPERVSVVSLPGPTSSPEDASVAQAVAEHVGLELGSIPIGPATVELEGALGIDGDDRIRGNIQARLRMTALYALAQANGHLVAGTGNKSELLVGYFTKHGDGASDLLPIGDLYKSQVQVLAEALGLPDPVIERPPTAGLWEGQTDEHELGIPYATLDVILAGIERQAADASIASEAGVAIEEVERIRGMVDGSWHKRNPPPVPKLGWRTVGVDWREPTMR